ncbi:glycosidase [Thermoanaerobacterium sp. DL9XJH110]|uniref:glycoside hydrolase family 130 protein n=1 Tax=Thermoanaerobacterium sp. DL9XJH110 TaxID=3386643 RepID=UPI003BB4A892
MGAGLKYGEDLFYETLENIKKDLVKTGEVDVVIGIPFYNEEETLPEVVRVARESLKSGNHSKLIVCAGDPAGEKVLKRLKEMDSDVTAFLMPSGVNGRGYSIRAIFEVARFFEADVVLLEADLKNDGERGLKPQWIDRLAQPIFGEYDLAIARFSRHPFEDITGNFLVSPLIETLYGMRFSDPLSGVFAISHDLVEDMCAEFDQFRERAGGYGINPWIVTTALKWQKRICEVYLGAKMSPVTLVKKNLVFKEMTRALIACIKKDEDFWLNNSITLKRPDAFVGEEKDQPLEVICDYKEFARTFKRYYFHYKHLFEKLLQGDLIDALDRLAESRAGYFNFLPGVWARVVYDILLAAGFESGVAEEDLLEALRAVYDGIVAEFLKQMADLEKALTASGVDAAPIISARARDIFEDFAHAFLAYKSEFLRKWKLKADEARPVLTPLDYLEFIPGVPIVLPRKLRGAGDREISTGDVFRRLQKKYENAFRDFMHLLGTDTGASSAEIGDKLKSFMQRMENTIDRLCPGDLHTAEGTMIFLRELFEIFPHKKVFCVKWEILRKLLYEFPPANLLLRLGYKNMRQLLDNMDVRDILTLAQTAEDKDYFDRIFYWLKDNLRPDSFEEAELKPLVISQHNFAGIGEFREISDLNRLTARIAVTSLGKGMGGDFPKLRYFTRVAKSIVEAEHFSDLWRMYARERKEVGRKFANSILGHYGKAMFSAHHIFENWHQREFAARLEILSRRLAEENLAEESKDISLMARGHGLSMILKDGTFMPCSAWSWASFSFKGGEGIPTPLFLHVERDWFNHDLLEEIYKEMGFNPGEIMEQVFQLISQGRESSDLTNALLGIKPPSEKVVIQEPETWPAAGELKRYRLNPILNPVKEHWWENRYVLNTAAIRIKDRVYLLYRAFGKDEVSRIGLAITDGYNVIERLDRPLFAPETEQEKKGCEDPRVVLINDEIFMLYTAYDGVVAQIAAASISIEDFLNRDFDRWKRRGLAFPGLWDKDALLFPEKIEGKYVIYHRLEPSIWMAYSDELVFPWPREGHKIIMGPRAGMMWDSLKIGAGSQPIKTRYGWLLIYHGVDQEMVYRLGVILADLKDPGRLLYRSPNPILSPETECEIGKKGECWVPNVVFTCGAVPAEDKEVLDDDDEILVYYGAADTNICLATGRVGELIPEEVRRRIKTM